MAIGKASDFKIYQAQFNGGFVEQTMQNIEAMTGGSRGAVQLRNEFIRGDYRQESFFPEISGLVTRRDTTSVAAATDIALTQDEFVSVKLARTLGPVAQTFDAWRKIGKDPKEVSMVVGAQSATAMLKEKLNTALTALVAALGGVAALVRDGTAGTVSHTELVRALGKMGDRTGDVVAWVMHSKVATDLAAQALSDKVPANVGGMVIVDGVVPTLNRPLLITDSPALVDTGSPDTYYTVGLVPGAIEVVDSEGTPDIVSDVVTGLKNLVLRFQGEYAYNLSLKGFKYDISGGGANPDDTAVGTAGNWTKVATDDKSCAGVLLKSQ